LFSSVPAAKDEEEEEEESIKKDVDYFALNTARRTSRSKKTVLERFQNKLALNVIGVLQKAEKRLKETERKEESSVGLSLLDDASQDGEEDTYDSANDSETTEELLETLFFNISSKVEKSVATRLQLKRADVYYYELVASYFGLDEHVDTVEKILLPHCVNLWSVELFPAVFALLMHRWVLKHDGQNKKGWLIRLNVLLKGSNQLFWFDTQHRTHRLLSLFCYIRNKLDGNAGIENEKKRADFAHMLCRFYYYYRSSKLERVNEFLSVAHVSLDTFVLETTAHLCAVGENDTLRIHYLQCLTRLNETRGADLEHSLERTTINKLHSTLNAFILPGAPFHPSMPVRNKARETMAVLFPHGQWSRSAINGLFTLLRPNYWLHELGHMLQYFIDTLYSFIPFGRSNPTRN